MRTLSQNNLHLLLLISADAFFRAAISLISEVPRTIGKDAHSACHLSMGWEGEESFAAGYRPGSSFTSSCCHNDIKTRSAERFFDP